VQHAIRERAGSVDEETTAGVMRRPLPTARGNAERSWWAAAVSIPIFPVKSGELFLLSYRPTVVVLGPSPQVIRRSVDWPVDRLRPNG
jgi:hypothetical protein